MMRSLTGFVGVFLFALIAACDDPAPDLAEWTVADHHNQGASSAKQQQQRRQPGKPPTYAAPSKRNPLVDVTWMKQCSNCHGKRGKGDGPESPMVKAKDLTTPEWQQSVTDEQIMAVIKNGKNKMPSFTFPDSMLTSLVAHVRSLPGRAARGAAGSPGGTGGAPAAPPADDEGAEGAEAPADGH
jgi:hypothetical protein